MTTMIKDDVLAQAADELHEMLTEIADHGFNLLRVPVSTQILLQWKNSHNIIALFKHMI